MKLCWFMDFNSRRSPVLGRNGAVASSQPLASVVGHDILKRGGNAADAAVAMAAVLNVTEPVSTGIGGDVFVLFYDAEKSKVRGINASGRAPKKLNINFLEEKGIKDKLPPFSPYTVTVPGAVAGWIDTIEKFGTMTLKEVLSPAIELAEKGFPVSPITAYSWKRGEKQLKQWGKKSELLINGRSPHAGEIMKNPNLAKVFREIVEHGTAGFYEGWVAEKIVKTLEKFGGVLTLEDLKEHRNTYPEPISINYKGVNVYEIPPNGQGITALIGLNIIENFEITLYRHNSAQYLHLLIETMRLAFADSRWYVTDPEFNNIPIEELLSKEYAKKRSELIDLEKAMINVEKGSPTGSSDTVYFNVVDGEGNACSFINSNYMGFGTGLIPEGTGFTLQNRGANFVLQRDHPNMLEPRKRPYHTIIPGMATYADTEELWGPFGVMGGFMQPQGHLQVLLNMIDFRMDPQTALDKSRFCILDANTNGKVAIEEGISFNTLAELARKGHNIVPVTGYARSVFGRGQIIFNNRDNKVLWAGSDPRADGMAIAY